MNMTVAIFDENGKLVRVCQRKVQPLEIERDVIKTYEHSSATLALARSNQLRKGEPAINKREKRTNLK